MAGIGFELNKLMNEKHLFGTSRAYFYSGIISTGPWVFSIVGILILGFTAIKHITNHFEVTQFQNSVTNLIAASLIFSGIFQFAFTRYVADQIFEKNIQTIVPNFNGALIAMGLTSGIFGLTILSLFFKLHFFSKLILNATFMLLCCIWISVSLLTGLKKYRYILFLFTTSYSSIVLFGYYLSRYGYMGLIFSFFVGNFILFIGIIFIIYRNYPSKYFLSLEFLKKNKMHHSLILTGVIYNLAVWIDKYIFWFTPVTGERVIGIFHMSVIYDLPIFLAYLTLIPGMAIFFLRLETDFAKYYKIIYDNICHGGTLSQINESHAKLVDTGRKAIVDIATTQAITILILLVIAPLIMKWVGIPTIYLHLFYIDTVGVGLQLVLMSIVNLLFYLDKRHLNMILAFMFFILNFTLSTISIRLGPPYYGTGFALSILLTIIVGAQFLNNAFDTLEFKTFMLQDK